MAATTKAKREPIKRTRVVCDIDPIDARKLRAIAEANERTMTAQVRLAIRDYLGRYGGRVDR